MKAELGHDYDMGLLARPFNPCAAALHPIGANAPVKCPVDD